MTNIKPLAPGEIRIATAEDGTEIRLMEVAGGSFIHVQVRQGLQLLYTLTRPSTQDQFIRDMYRSLCRVHDAS
jgi:tRNA U38,U39,U40 pseudouridine synthase TruA